MQISDNQNIVTFQPNMIMKKHAADSERKIYFPFAVFCVLYSV